MDKITAAIMCVFMFYAGYKSFNVLNQEVEPEIKPPACISFREAISRKEKYDYFIDRLNSASKKDKPRWQDSVKRQTKLIQF